MCGHRHVGCTASSAPPANLKIGGSLAEVTQAVSLHHEGTNPRQPTHNQLINPTLATFQLPCNARQQNKWQASQFTRQISPTPLQPRSNRHKDMQLLIHSQMCLYTLVLCQPVKAEGRNRDSNVTCSLQSDFWSETE